MVKEKKLGWIFRTDGFQGIPYLQCPYCNRRVSGKKAINADISLEKCPECGKNLHFDNVKEEDWLHMSSYFGREQ